MRVFLFFAYVSLFLVNPSNGQKQVRNTKWSGLTHILKNVIPCQSNASLGTCTMADTEVGTVVFTAKHLWFRPVISGETVELKFLHNTNPIHLTFTAYTDPNLDLVMLVPIESTGTSLPSSELKFGDIDYTLSPGDDVLALGFPQAILLNSLSNTDYGYAQPIPKFLKYASILLDDNGKGLFLFDGTVSPGMSGGPVLYFDEQKQTWTLLAIMTAAIVDRSTTPDNRISIGFSTGYSLGVPARIFSDYYDSKNAANKK